MNDVTGQDFLGQEDSLFSDLASLIEDARVRVATTVNSELLMLYWGIGKRIRDDVLGGERAEYGSDVVKRVVARLSARFGRGYGWRNLFRMMKFVELYPNVEILSPLATKLTWTNVCELLTIDEQGKRDFYMAMSAHERWSKRTLRAKVDGKLYERAVHAAGSCDGITVGLATTGSGGITNPTMAFRDPYVLDFLGLDAKHSEAALEQAILDEMQRFLLELGADLGGRNPFRGWQAQCAMYWGLQSTYNS